jgi:thymidylate synthase (FAD)
MTKVLDHGYATMVETWGSDERIIEAARMSTGKGFLGWGPLCGTCKQPFETADEECPNPTPGTPLVDCGKGGHYFDAPGDEKLLRFLWENKHATPFEMAGATVEIQAPIMVFREWHRHRTQSYNEMSGRYIELPELFYVPSVERMTAGGQSATNKQGSGAALPASTVDTARSLIHEQCANSFEMYRQLLAMGVSKEIARVLLPVNTYSRMRASANLRNWLAFLSLRSSAKNPAAQWEIRQFADAVHMMLAEAFPRTLALFDGGAK